MSKYFTNIQDFMDESYGIKEEAAKAINKAADPMLTTTTGMFNAIFGRMAFNQFNQEANAWNVLPKKGWTTSGWRIRTARGFTVGTTYGGIADGGTLDDSIKSTVVEVTCKPKISHLVFEIGTMTDLLDGDDRYTFEEEMKNKAQDHIIDIDSQLLTDADTLADVQFESIDRVCCSNSEVSALLTAGDGDIYGLDRDAVTTYDAYVDHNSGVDRAITTSLIRTAITTIQQNSGKRPNVILTGFDQYENIMALYESQTRYMTDTTVKLGVNGVQTPEGVGVGLQVNAIYGIPIVLDQNVATDTGSRIYFLNTETLFIGIAKPTQVKVTDDITLLGYFKKRAVYYTIGELICTMFSANGKIRDLL